MQAYLFIYELNDLIPFIRKTPPYRMSKQYVTFSNPDCLPVEHVSLEVTNDGVFQKISALDSYWVEPREFIVYVIPPSGSTLELGAIDEWKNNMEGYLDDVKWLLSLEYHRFWSTIIYHNKCMDSLVSYLQEGTPPYMPPHDSKDVQNLCTEIRKYVLRVFSRLITNKESKFHWMTKEYMSDLIYNNFIFTIPILWDICLLYGIDNKQHVSRLVNSVFKLQTNYEGDVKAAVSFINESFKYIILQVNKDYDSVDPPNLPETFKGFGEIRRPSGNKTVEKLTFSMLKDLVLHLLDTAMTLRIFVEIYSKCVKILRQVNFVNSMVQMYEHGVPQLYAKLEETGDRTSVDYTEVEQYIDLARSEFIDIFKEVLLVYKNAIFNDDGNKSVHVEDYLAVMMDALSEKLFIRDYHAAYPVHEDIELLREACPNIDTVKTDFILQAIYSNLEDPLENSISSSESSSDDDSDDSTPAQVIRREKNDDGLPDVFEVEALIKKVKDVLPHLGDGFILKCIKVYGLNSDRIINVVLENNLDDSLKGEDQTLPIIPDDPLDKLYLETGYDRLNVFDGDEFDFKVRDDIDMSRVHFGKRKPEYKDVNQMLNDKTEVKLMSGIFNKYSLITDEEALYDDEYDDTGYDGIAPPAPDEVEHQRRPFVTPRALRTKEDRVEEEESQDDSEVEEPKPGTSNGRNRLDFCVNPEEVRARREANMQLRRGRGARGARPPVAPKTKDVVGKPKGQGQEKEVLANRDKKEKHKSSRANHNRRQGAQWKRSQGMMPS